MNDFYKTLGVAENASQDEIQRAYRKLAMKHHPDRGGDQSKFKDISAAYDILSDGQKRAEYDQQRHFGGQRNFHFHTGNGGFDQFADMFGGGNPFAGGPFADMFGRQMRRNRDLNIQCQITLIDSFNGKQLEANYVLPSGRTQTVVINVPPGVSHGETIRYAGLGDDSLPGAPRGNLNVTIIVTPDPFFRRQGDDLYANVEITPIEAMIGCRKTIKTISGQSLDLDIRPGVEHGTEYASHGNGFPNVNNPQFKGRFVTIVQIRTPSVIDQELVKQLKELDAKISQRT